MNYADAIKEYRRKALITQEELADKLGVSFATVNRWEMGHHVPTMKMKRKLRPLLLKKGIKVDD
ncbi:MAG: helix-turn-helix transcriptional regulator [Bacilli bacterium]|nr:helix-turn-helix transcriptional regulator [Bacilli bacterium]